MPMLRGSRLQNILYNMAIVKRLHLFVLKSFLPLFAMTFFIVLFIVLMQFLWKYIDDLVGKGLSFSVLGELFFYAAVTMVPMALPLAILLASLMTFGNMGERLELTAMKASGISLLQVMAPLIIFVSALGAGAFFFQNNVLPTAQVKMWTLLFSMRQKSPELEIPEGSFYSQIPGYSLIVKHKNRETGIMHDIMIYDVSRGGDNSTILLADSARLAFTHDMRYLYLHLFKGEQFENLRDQTNMDKNVPFRRESFLEKEILIPFDANFNRLDEGGMRNQYVGKNISQLQHTIDSVSQRIDSIGALYTEPVMRGLPNIGRALSREELEKRQLLGSRTADSRKEEVKKNVSLDSLLDALDPGRKMELYARARESIRNQKTSTEFQVMTISEEKRNIRRHEIELIKKFTLSIACIIFFFIGAPLGAIIRKGGLGTPLVISVLLFLFYYIIDNTGYKMARDGRIAVWFGIWLSTFVMAPLGIYVTYKAMNDSAVFDKDVYVRWFRKVFGIREARSVAAKEVVINDISRKRGVAMLEILREDTRVFLDRYRKIPGFNAYFSRGIDMEALDRISRQVDETVEYLQDSRNMFVVNKLQEYPIIRHLRIYRLWRSRIPGKIFEFILPLSLPLYLVARRCYKALFKELRTVVRICDEELEIISEIKD